MKKIRVLHLIGSANPGGAETFALRLMTKLHQQKNIDLLVVARRGSWIAEQLRRARVPVQVASFGGILDFMLGRTGATVQHIADEFKPAVVQSWMNRATRFMPKGKWQRVARLGGFYNLKYYRGKVKELITNTEKIREYCIENGWPAAHVTMLANFVPTPPAGWQGKRAQARNLLDIPSKAKVLLMAGRLHPVKGVDVALRALAKLPKDTFLVLAGEGESRGELEALAKKLGVAGRVRFAGWIDDISPLAAAADVWWVPSRKEPLGNTALDAWAHSKPVVASKVQGLAMLISEAKTGLLVPAGDYDALANTTLRLLGDAKLVKQVTLGAARRLAAIYGEAMVVKQYVDYYERLISKE